jgi:hypothetical protein
MPDLTSAQKIARFDRLPKWAREEMRDMANKNLALKDELQVSLGLAPESDYFFEDYMIHRGQEPSRIYMPGNRGRIFVNVGQGRYKRDDLIVVTREDRYGLGGIRLQADSEIHLTMGSSNTVWITPHSINTKDKS